MSGRRLTLGLVLAGALSSAAFAFQEVQQGAPAAGSSAAPVQQDDKRPGMGLQLPDLNKSSSGTEVRIPGLGKLGVLPKLDFGLELLYGAAETHEPPPSSRTPQDDVTIRGSIKHKF